MRTGPACLSTSCQETPIWNEHGPLVKTSSTVSEPSRKSSTSSEPRLNVASPTIWDMGFFLGFATCSNMEKTSCRNSAIARIAEGYDVMPSRSRVLRKSIQPMFQMVNQPCAQGDCLAFERRLGGGIAEPEQVLLNSGNEPKQPRCGQQPIIPDHPSCDYT
jgi:hypothetical protein